MWNRKKSAPQKRFRRVAQPHVTRALRESLSLIPKEAGGAIPAIDRMRLRSHTSGAELVT